MDCPICNNPMIVLELNQVEVDHCTTCGGVWLDADEMDLLLEGSERREEIRRGMQTEEAGGEEKRRCPICSKKMTKLRVKRDGIQETVVIDRCAQDHGTLLDGGELQKIVALSDFPAAHRIHEFLQAIFRGPTSPRAR